MAISNYAELKAALSTWADRDYSDEEAETFIQLAEATLNRELSAVETKAEIEAAAGSRSIDISNYKVIHPLSVFIMDGSDERQVIQSHDSQMPYEMRSGIPRFWSIDGDRLYFDCMLDADYAVRMNYVGRFALSDEAPTNALLANHPDIYLAACLVWGGMYDLSDAVINRYSAALDVFVKSHKLLREQAMRGRLTVDPALVGCGRLKSSRGAIGYVGYGTDYVFYGVG